jgi:hypothetical protein
MRWIFGDRTFYHYTERCREALSSLSACPWLGTLKKPTQAGGGFLECATFLNFTTGLPASYRGEQLLMIEYFWTLGVLYIAILAYIFLDFAASTSNAEMAPLPDRPWRIFAALCACPCVVSLVAGCCVVPQRVLGGLSPRGEWRKT